MEGGSVSGAKMRDSPFWHNTITNSSAVVYFGLELRSTSSHGKFQKNTDGWDFCRSTRVTIENSTITNRDGMFIFLNLYNFLFVEFWSLIDCRRSQARRQRTLPTLLQILEHAGIPPDSILKRRYRSVLQNTILTNTLHRLRLLQTKQHLHPRLKPLLQRHLRHLRRFPRAIPSLRRLRGKHPRS